MELKLPKFKWEDRNRSIFKQIIHGLFLTIHVIIVMIGMFLIGVVGVFLYLELCKSGIFILVYKIVKLFGVGVIMIISCVSIFGIYDWSVSKDD